MGLSTYKPEGWKIDTPKDRATVASMTALMDACRDEKILESRALVCDSFHSLLVDLGCMKGLIPQEEGALGIRENTIRDIAIISHVSQPVCFVITGFQKDDAGNPTAVLSRRATQEKYQRKYIEKLRPGDMTDARVAHLEAFGTFADTGHGTILLLPIGAISASRIDHPKKQFIVGMDVRTIVRLIKGDRITFAQKELLSTWEENAAPSRTGETVTGTIRSIELYGVLVKPTPDLVGLAEIKEDVLPG